MRPPLGSYIGAFIGLILAFLSFRSLDVICEFWSCKENAYLFPIFLVIISFLLGWLIHTIFFKTKTL